MNLLARSALPAVVTDLKSAAAAWRQLSELKLSAQKSEVKHLFHTVQNFQN